MSPIPSPCTNVCILDGVICTGCGRTNEEIARWSTMNAEERKRIVLRVCPSLLEE